MCVFETHFLVCHGAARCLYVARAIVSINIAPRASCFFLVHHHQYLDCLFKMISRNFMSLCFSVSQMLLSELHICLFFCLKIIPGTHMFFWFFPSSKPEILSLCFSNEIYISRCGAFLSSFITHYLQYLNFLFQNKQARLYVCLSFCLKMEIQ